ncbi:MAG TPA: PspC domain-containing protein, partial [Chitinophagales bacterium]
MKKTINIHLGGMPFIIDEDAYNILHNYIESLKAKFTNEYERNEIIADIEARVAEVFTTRLEKDKRQVVEENDVNNVISQLGKPEDIAGNSASEAEQTTQSQQQTSYTNRTFTPRGEKKLFRDTDNKIAGGVISGLCQYFGYSEPIWARIIFALFLWFSFGTFLIVYFVFWLLVPEAKTAADKLQMRGEAVTLDNIQKEVQDTIGRANDAFNRSVKDDNVGAKIVTILLVLLKGFLKVLSVFVFIICLFILIVFVAAVFGFSMLGMPAFAPITSLFVDSHFIYIITLVAGTLAIGIPLFSIMYACARFVLSNKVDNNKTVSTILGVLWGASIAALFTIFPFVACNFSTEESVREELQISQPSGKTLAIAS